jgi:hypothetical protein
MRRLNSAIGAGPRPPGRRRLDDEEGGRLLAANVAARGLRGLQRGEHPPGQVAARPLERGGHRGPDLGIGHHVGLHGVLGADLVTGVPDVELPAESIDAALRVDHRDLPHLALRIGGEQAFQHLGRRDAGAHQLEPLEAVRRVDKRLRRHRAHARLGPGDD